jgi:uncharacterized repeat protein (TIGR01451 family)
VYYGENDTVLKGRQLENGENPDGAIILADIEDFVRAASAPLYPAFDLGDDGVTPNDPGDLDGLQNYPVITSAVVVNGLATIEGSLSSLANTSFRIEFYSNISPDPSGYGPGENYLGHILVSTNAQGEASFTFTPTVGVAVGRIITSTATLLGDLDGDPTTALQPIQTSEFSADVATTIPPSANLSVSESATPNPAPTGGNQTFSLTVANAGPNSASGVQLVVTPPAGAAFVSATGGVAPVGGTLTFDLGTLANQASVTVSVTVRLDAPGTLVGSATVTSSTPDPATADNTTTVTVPGDSVGPTISSVLASSSPKDKCTPVVLTFSEDLGPVCATNLANYRLVTAGRDKKFGTKDDKVVALRSATYNPTTRTVTLVPRKKLAVAVKYSLTVDGTTAHGLTDRAGNLLDGNRDGRASGNYVVVFKLVHPKVRRRS